VARQNTSVVVIPSYNEAENLAEVVAAVRKLGLSVIVVDDNSPDGTGAIAERLAASDPEVQAVHRASKGGLGPAYARGFATALAAGFEQICQMDADFSHDPNDLPRLLEALEAGADLALGSRYVTGGGTGGWPWSRQLISRLGNAYARAALGIPIRDATSGFRAFRAGTLRMARPESCQASGYGFQVEMAWRALQAGHSVQEVPITFHERRAGRSKMTPGIALEAARLLTVWGFRRRLGQASTHA